MLFYQGKWSPGKGKAFKSLNPMNNETIWEGNFSNIPQLKSAINSAASSHLEWSRKSPQSRIKVIKIFYALLEKNKLAMTRLIATETGKTNVDASSEVAATLAKLNNSIKCQLIILERTHHDESVIELISKTCIRKNNKLKDGSKISIKIEIDS